MEWDSMRREQRRESRIESTVEVLELRIRGTKDRQGRHTGNVLFNTGKDLCLEINLP